MKTTFEFDGAEILGMIESAIQAKCDDHNVDPAHIELLYCRSSGKLIGARYVVPHESEVRPPTAA